MVEPFALLAKRCITQNYDTDISNFPPTDNIPQTFFLLIVYLANMNPTKWICSIGNT